MFEVRWWSGAHFAILNPRRIDDIFDSTSRVMRVKSDDGQGDFQNWPHFVPYSGEGKGWGETVSLTLTSYHVPHGLPPSLLSFLGPSRTPSVPYKTHHRQYDAVALWLSVVDYYCIPRLRRWRRQLWSAVLSDWWLVIAASIAKVCAKFKPFIIWSDPGSVESDACWWPLQQRGKAIFI